MTLINKLNNQVIGKENNCYTLNSYERFILAPCEKKWIDLPVYKTFNDKEYVVFELNEDLLNKGIICLGTNLNKSDSSMSIKILLYNINIDREYEIRNNPMMIFGSRNKVDFPSKTELGKIWEVKI